MFIRLIVWYFNIVMSDDAFTQIYLNCFETHLIEHHTFEGDFCNQKPLLPPFESAEMRNLAETLLRQSNFALSSRVREGVVLAAETYYPVI
jgi:hypothetical protein